MVRPVPSLLLSLAALRTSAFEFLRATRSAPRAAPTAARRTQAEPEDLGKLDAMAAMAQTRADAADATDDAPEPPAPDALEAFWRAVTDARLVDGKNAIVVYRVGIVLSCAASRNRPRDR